METIDEIVEGLFQILERVGFDGGLLEEEVEEMLKLSSAYFIWRRLNEE